MMDEELHLQPVGTPDILRSALVIGIATLIGHVIPLVPFLVLSRSPGLVVSIVLSGFVLFGVGVYSAKTLVGDWRTMGLKMVAIGLGAAAIGVWRGTVVQQLRSVTAVKVGTRTRLARIFRMRFIDATRSGRSLAVQRYAQSPSV